MNNGPDLTIHNEFGTKVEKRRVGYWGPADFYNPRRNRMEHRDWPAEGVKDDWVILCNKPGAVGPIEETRTVTYTAWEATS